MDYPYHATLIQLTPADMPKEQIITRLIPELVRECSKQAQLGFAPTVKQALVALDAPMPQVHEVAPKPPASDVVATKPPDLEAAAPSAPALPPRPSRKPHQSSHKSTKPNHGVSVIHSQHRLEKPVKPG